VPDHARVVDTSCGGVERGDLTPNRETVSHFGSPLGRAEQMPPGPKVRRDATESRQGIGTRTDGDDPPTVVAVEPLPGQSRSVSALAALRLPSGRVLLASGNDCGELMLWDGRSCAAPGPWENLWPATTRVCARWLRSQLRAACC